MRALLIPITRRLAAAIDVEPRRVAVVKLFRAQRFDVAIYKQNVDRFEVARKRRGPNAGVNVLRGAVCRLNGSAADGRHWLCGSIAAVNPDISAATDAIQQMAASFALQLPKIVLAIIVFFLFFFAGKLVRGLVRKFAERNKQHYNLGLVLGRLAQSAMVFVGLLVALVIAVPSFKAGQLVNVLGLSSVAFGFAFRDILQNFLAGILILLSEPFRIGDQIKINDFEGTVKEIQTRATFIHTYDGRIVVIPNSNLFTNSVTVNTANEKRRLQYDIGIGYSDNIARAKQIMLDVVNGIDEVLEEPAPDALVVDLAGSSVNIRVRYWISPPRQTDVLHVQDKVLEQIKHALTQAGIDMPFPTQQVLWHDQTEITDGDRATQREGWPKGAGEAPKPLKIASVLRDKRERDKREGDQSEGLAQENKNGDKN